jgi:hypothetical protein
VASEGARYCVSPRHSLSVIPVIPVSDLNLGTRVLKRRAGLSNKAYLLTMDNGSGLSEASKFGGRPTYYTTASEAATRELVSYSTKLCEPAHNL